MIERIGLTVLLVTLGWFISRGASRLILRRRVPGVAGYQPGLPAILFFTSPDCAPCETIQRPEIAQVREYYGEQLQVIEIDAPTNPDVADAWGVFTLPTTFVIDSRGQPGGVNLGIANAKRLREQLETLGEFSQRNFPGEPSSIEERVRVS
jgi:thiol-disulfide isomerase/thioredoxin